MNASDRARPRVGRVAALAVCLTLGVTAPRRTLAHGGVPVRLVADAPAGPYVVSLWAKGDVGMGIVYVVYRARDRAAFVAPVAVHVGVTPVAGRRAEVLYDAHPEAVRHGARYVAHVAFDRDETWRVRVLTDGPTPVPDVRAQIDVAPAMLGPFGILLYATPFVLLGGLWWRVAVVRRAARHRATGLRHAFTPG